MRSGVPWQMQGVRQQTLDAVRDAARRSGLSLDEWLGHVINHSASLPDAEAPMLQAGPTLGGLSEIKDRLGAIGRQLDRMAGASADHAQRRVQEAAPSIAADPPTTLDQALMEIAARQRVLDGEPRERSRRDELPRAPTQGFSGLEQQLREVSSRIETLRPCGIDAALQTLRDDLAEIGLMLKEAMPRQAIAALEAEVRMLAERVAGTPHAGLDGAALNGIEQGLAEVRDALRALTPAEHLIGFDGAIAELSRKIDQIAGGRDPASLAQLESAVAELREIVSNVASNEALTALGTEVHALAEKVEQLADAGGADLLSTLEQRIETLTDALQARNGHSIAPQDSPLDERVTRLIEKLEVSDARLSQLQTIEQTLTALVEHFEREPASSPAVSNPAEIDAITHDVRRAQDSLDQMHGTLGHLVDRMAAIESGLRPLQPAENGAAALAASLLRATTPVIAAPATPPPASLTDAPPASASPVTRAPSRAAPAGPPPAQERRPIDPNLPPDHPLEPGSANRGRVASPAERIAASEAAIRAIKPPVIPDPAERPNFIAAARRAAQAAASAARDESRAAAPAAQQANGKAAVGWGSRVRSLLVGTSVLLIVLGSVHLVANLLSASREAARPTATAAPAQPIEAIPSEPAQSAEPSRSAPTQPPETDSAPSAPSPGRQSMLLPGAERSPFPPPPGAVPLPAATEPDITNALGSAAPREAEPALSPTASAAAELPLQIGGETLRTAASKGDAAAEFEVALRYAEGRGVPQDLAKAAEWLQRAADQGLVPAQFRLGSLYEKGLGVAKDLDAARRLYLAAAEAGNAKAMHNLAVIYAEGIDGKPDYQTAAKWFAKAADHGVIDSQFNLAVLYARGIGVQANLVEAYKWFALAGRDGDKESARKRDDVARRLDQQSLAAAKLAVEHWTAQPQPEAAVGVKAPPGGWDDAAPTVRSKRQAAAPKLGLNLPIPPRPVQ